MPTQTKFIKKRFSCLGIDAFGHPKNEAKQLGRLFTKSTQSLDFTSLTHPIHFWRIEMRFVSALGLALVLCGFAGSNCEAAGPLAKIHNAKIRLIKRVLHIGGGRTYAAPATASVATPVESYSTPAYSTPVNSSPVEYAAPVEYSSPAEYSAPVDYSSPVVEYSSPVIEQAY